MFGFVLSPLEKIGGAIAIILVALLGFKIWIAAHDAGVREGYVLQSEVFAAQAQTAEVERQRNAAAQALDDAEKRRAADAITSQAIDTKTQLELADYEKRIAAAGRQCQLDHSDVRFILQH